MNREMVIQAREFFLQVSNLPSCLTKRMLEFEKYIMEEIKGMANGSGQPVDRIIKVVFLILKSGLSDSGEPGVKETFSDK